MCQILGHITETDCQERETRHKYAMSSKIVFRLELDVRHPLVLSVSSIENNKLNHKF